MPRDFDQIMRSRETDSWSRQFQGSPSSFNGTTLYIGTNSGTVSYIGTVSGTSHLSGTVSLSVSPIDGDDLQFVTDLSFSSNLSGCKVDLLNGTAFLYSMKLPSADKFVEFFNTPLKTSKGTALNIDLYNMWGTSFLNISGYTVK